MNTTTLDLLAERVAEKVIERLGVFIDDRQPATPSLGCVGSCAPPGLVDAAEIAQRFGCSRDWVYAHADELGAIRLGDGDKPRLRFDPEVVHERLAARPHPATTPTRTRPRPRATASIELLPIRGDS